MLLERFRTATGELWQRNERMLVCHQSARAVVRLVCQQSARAIVRLVYHQSAAPLCGWFVIRVLAPLLAIVRQNSTIRQPEPTPAQAAMAVS
jgi:hypothetical protein